MKTKAIGLIMTLMGAALLSACAGAVFAQSGTPTVEEASVGERTGNAEPVNRTVAVTGSGKVYLTPDIVYVTIGVRTDGPVASDAVAENNQLSQQVIDALKGLGIEEKDIQTTNFSIYPQQVYDDQGKPTGKINYQVENSVYVTVRDITTIGDVLDAAVKAGANSISGIQFDVADRTQAQSEARQAAVKDAQTKALELSSAAGVTLGAVQTMSEYTSGGPVPMYDMRAAPASMAAEAASVPVSSGQLVITVDVNIVYGIQ